MRRFRSLALHGLSAIAVAAGALASPAFAQAGKSVGSNTYIVQLSALPVATNPSTAAPAGGKLDSSSPAVQAYMASLAAQQNAVMASAGVTNKLYTYGYTFNGFAAQMTAEQAAKLSKTAGVVSVNQSEIAQLDTATTPAFLGLTGPNGFYSQSGAKGENVIIGIVDSGVWTNHPSFAGAGFGAPPPKWKGTCQTGQGFTAAECNNKLIGARFYNVGPGGNAGVTAKFPQEFNSPKDADGHGTHTASTSGGNEGVSTAGSVAAAFGTINGIAPRARVAIYKACWGSTGQVGTGCYTPDTVAAIDQAVADGVDVINYSISGTQSDVTNPVEVAFRNAAAAGVFVAASAGNSGPGNFQVAHPSPWITTVAAATHNRATTGILTLGSGATFTGASVAITAVPAGTPMILSSSAIRAGRTLNDANLCFSSKDAGGNALDPALVAGKIVVCDRGVTDRVNKSLAVQEAGGVGMILINPTANTTVSDFHAVPSIHLNNDVRTAVRTYVAGPTPTGAISLGMISLTNPAPTIASFSSRGPIPSNAANVNMLIKPDISAPGVDILAGSSPIGNANASIFALLSGTSMSSPHIAGIAALIKQARPGWSPMAIKSAMMTTAGNVLDGSRDSIGVLAMHGAGFVNPSAALNPGLVFDSGVSDWNSYLCGQGLISQPSCLFFNIDASDLNLPSIGVFNLAGSKTVKRRVTNVSGATQTFTSTVAGLAGYNVVVSPASLTVGAGQTADFTVQITRTTAGTGSYSAGSLTLTSGATTVRIPMQVHSTTDVANAPAQVFGTGGLMKVKLNIGYTGPFSATVRGLIAPQLNSGTASTNSSQTFPVVVPAGTTYARFSLFDADVKPGSDIDIIVRDPGGATVGTGFNGNSQEEVSLVNPAAGTYTVEVAGFNVNGTSPFKLHSWVLGTASAGNVQAYAPSFVTAGQTIEISLIPLPWGLSYGTRYLGSLAYSGNPNLPAPTIIRLDR